jgi:hypothetical protein
MESIMVRAAASRRHLLQRLGSRSWWTFWARSSPDLGQKCASGRTAPDVLVYLVVSCADMPASALDGGSWARSLSCVHVFVACCVLPGCVLCSCSRCACLSAHTCGAGSDSSRVTSRYVCVTCKRCTACCLGIKSGTLFAGCISVPLHVFFG